MSSSAVRRPKQSTVTATVAPPKTTTNPPPKTHRSTTPVSERIICRNRTSVNIPAGKENGNGSSCRSTSRIRAAAAAKPAKPIVPAMARAEKDGAEPRARWSSNMSAKGRSSSPCDFNNNIVAEIRKTRVSRVSVDRYERTQRSVSVDRSARVSRVSKLPDCKSGSENKNSEILKELKPKPLKIQSARVSIGSTRNDSENEIVSHAESLNSVESNPDSVMKVSESVKLFEKFKSKSGGLKSSNVVETEENDARLSVGKLSRGSGSDGVKEKGGSEDVTSSRSSVKYPSKLHGKLAFLEEKVKRIASDIKRTKEMLDLNNPDASKVMLSDIQETVAGIEKAMCDVVSGGSGEEKKGESLQVSATKKNSPIKELSDRKSSAKGSNTDELEARFFPHHKLLRDRSTLKAPAGTHEAIKTEAGLAVTETKPEGKLSSTVDEKCIAPLIPDSLSKGESKVTVRGGSEICEVQETDENVNSRGRDSSNTYIGKCNVETMLTANETLEDCDEEENKAVMIYVEEIDDSFNNQLNEIGHKASTGGWFVSEGESVLLAHDDGSCTFYDVANSEEKSVYNAPAAISPNLWRDCWVVRAPGVDGCSGRYVVAASAGNSMDSGFCSWDFYTKEVKSFHIEDGVTNTRTALAPLPNNVLNRRHDLTNLTPENRQWWYKPCGPLIISTASNQKGVRIYDIRDGEHIMKWDVQSFVLEMDNSSPLQWRNRGKVVLAETESVSLWDVGSLTPEPLLSVSSNGKKITALHVNNTDAELGGGVRQRVSSSEAEGNDGVFCTSDSINILDFRHPSGIGLKIPKYGTTAHSVFSRGDSIYLGCSSSSSSARKPPSTAQIQQFSLRKQKLFTTYILPESNSHPHYKAITQVWGNSDVAMGVCGSGLFVFDALKDDGSKPLTSDNASGERVRETIGPDNLYCPTFDYMGSRALLISRDRPAYWKYLC
ncbi:putative transcription factor WD40-like family [Helianthus annuus]|nr:putative transcription factor WD40-like family [Helianthus annuus]